MNREKLIKLAKELHQEAFDANAYYLIMQQYRRFREEYNDEMQLSPAFYQVVYEALQKACFMEIAKLYDKSSHVVTIGSLLKECQDNLSLFPEYRNTITVKGDGKEYSFQVPYHHHLKPEEECFFKAQVESQREIFRIFDASDPDSMPVQVDLTFSEFLELYQKRFQSLSKKRENIRAQRNKIYAHNDVEYIMDDEIVYQRNPITYPDIQELIEFALNCTGLILGTLTDVCQATRYSNIDDWEGTLMIARLGLKYKEYDMEQGERAIWDEYYLQNKG